MGLDIEDWYLDVILPLGKRNRACRTEHYSQLNTIASSGMTAELSQLLLIPTMYIGSLQADLPSDFN